MSAPRRSSTTIENADYAAFMRRAVRAFVRRAADDPEALPLLAALADELNDAVNTGIAAAHAEGYSYGEIAARLGITRQAVQQRIARQRRVDADSTGADGSGGASE